MIIKVDIPKWGTDRLEGILCSAAAMQLEEADLQKAREMSHGEEDSASRSAESANPETEAVTT